MPYVCVQYAAGSSSSNQEHLEVCILDPNLVCALGRLDNGEQLPPSSHGCITWSQSAYKLVREEKSHRGLPEEIL